MDDDIKSKKIIEAAAIAEKKNNKHVTKINDNAGAITNCGKSSLLTSASQTV